MNVQRFSFQEFSEVASAKAAVAKTFLPTGRHREEAPPPPPAPTFNEEQLKAAEREAYKKGFLEGTEEGKRQAENEQARVDAALTQTAEKFAASLAPVFTSHRQLNILLKEQLPVIALAIARKVAAAALEQNAQAVVEEIAMRCCEAMSGEPKLSITVQDKLGDTLEKKLQAMAAKLPSATDIIVVRDAAMPAADCRIEWSKGGMERKTDQLWQQMEKIIADLATTARRDATSQMDTLMQESGVTPVAPDSGSTGSNETVNQPDPVQSPGDAQDVTKKE
jgi:flagellar biosynthesis/type III secretory pathway protein FliH